jgi:prophage antirepressor-like protein
MYLKIVGINIASMFNNQSEESRKLLDEISTYEGKSITVIEIDSQPWFLASEICKRFQIIGTSSTVNHISEENKRIIKRVIGSRGEKNVIVLNELGFYSLILRTTKIQAKPYQLWFFNVFWDEKNKELAMKYMSQIYG